MSLVLVLALTVRPMVALSGDAETRVNHYIIEVYKRQAIEREREKVNGMRVPQVVEDPTPLSEFDTKAKSHGVVNEESVDPFKTDPTLRDSSSLPPHTNLQEQTEREVLGYRDLSSTREMTDREIVETVKRNARASGYLVEFDPQNPTKVIRIYKPKK